MWCETDSSFHVMRSIVVNRYSMLQQGECPSLGFRLNPFHSVTTFTLTDIINKKQRGLQLLTQQPAATKLTEVATCQDIRASTDWAFMSLHLSAYVFLVCSLAGAHCFLFATGASVCNAAANSLRLNQELRAMWECCQFSTGEGLIHSVSDAINQTKHPSALLEEFL